MGVRFDANEQRFVFDFEHDGAADIVSLTGDGYEVEAFGRCFYYLYYQSPGHVYSFLQNELLCASVK